MKAHRPFIFYIKEAVLDILSLPVSKKKVTHYMPTTFNKAQEGVTGLLQGLCLPDGPSVNMKTNQSEDNETGKCAGQCCGH